MKVLVIGGIAAGLKSAAKVRRCNPQAEITIVEKGELVSYGACGMPYYVGGDIMGVKQLMTTGNGTLRNAEFFKKVKELNVLTNTEAIQINRTDKTVKVKNVLTGEENDLSYDKLVIATGATPVKPALPGIELGNIYQMSHPNDAEAVRKALEAGKVERAVIIGAGLIGIEMAEALRNWEVDVSIIEMKDHIFPAFLDADTAYSVQKYAEEQGIHILTGEKVERFTGTDAVTEVVTDKRTIATDLVILAIGVRPNVELARQAGLKIGETGAIAVGEYLQTSDPDIYAGGDCVENTNIVSCKKVFAPMGSTANKQGRIIGENICGGRVKFRGVLNTVAVKLIDFNVGKVGLTEQEVKALGYNYVTATVAGHDKPHYMPDAKIITIKLIADADNRRVLGAQAYGLGDVSKRIDVIAAVLTFGGTIDDLFDIDLSYAPPFNGPIDNAAVAANAVMNKLAGRMKGISVLEAKEKLDKGSTVFLDVRAPFELKKMRIAGCPTMKNIPLGELRSRVQELNKEDEVIAICKIGLRGYEASMILQGAGCENAKVLEGGLTAWPFECENS